MLYRSVLQNSGCMAGQFRLAQTKPICAVRVSCVHMLPPHVYNLKNQKRFLACVCIDLYIIVGSFCTSGEIKIGFLTNLAGRLI